MFNHVDFVGLSLLYHYIPLDYIRNAINISLLEIKVKIRPNEMHAHFLRVNDTTV